MEEKLKLKNVIALAIQLLFAVFCFTISIVNIDSEIKEFQCPVGHDNFIIAVVSVAVILYAFLYFNKPHSNLFRYTMIILGFGIGCVALSTYASATLAWGAQLIGSLLFVASLIICFVSGRLHKFLRANILIGIALVLTLAAEIMLCIQRGFMPDFQFSFTLLTIAVLISYNVRFAEHKQAGIDADNEVKENA